MSPNRLLRAPAESPEAQAWWLHPAACFDGEQIRRDAAVRIENGRISAITPAHEAGLDGLDVWRCEYLACPAFVDLQVNGGGGVLFTQDPTPESLAAIAAAHRLGGTGTWLPTLITCGPEVMERAVEAVIDVHGRFVVAGMHIEGPHIAP